MNEDKLPIYQLGLPTVSTIKPVISSGIKTTGTNISTTGFNPYANRTATTTTTKQSYYDRKGETRFDTIMNATGQIVNTVAGITSIVNEWKGGRTVYIQDSSTGEQRPASASEIAYYEQRAQELAQNGQNYVNFREIIEEAQKNQPKDNTMVYVGIGVGVLLLGGIAVMAMNKK